MQVCHCFAEAVLFPKNPNGTASAKQWHTGFWEEHTDLGRRLQPFMHVVRGDLVRRERLVQA